MIDTGANVTVFNNPQYYTQLKSKPNASFIRFGPSAEFLIEGECTIHFCITDLDKVFHSVYLEHVMYVPTQPHNIVCLKSLQALNSGVNFDYTPYHIRWRIDNTDHFQQVYFSENIPHAYITLPSQVNTVKHVPNSSHLQAYTHARLGHISAAKLQSLHRAGLLNNHDKPGLHLILESLESGQMQSLTHIHLDVTFKPHIPVTLCMPIYWMFPRQESIVTCYLFLTNILVMHFPVCSRLKTKLQRNYSASCDVHKCCIIIASNTFILTKVVKSLALCSKLQLQSWDLPQKFSQPGAINLMA
jgi:hypothetical protein